MPTVPPEIYLFAAHFIMYALGLFQKLPTYPLLKSVETIQNGWTIGNIPFKNVMESWIHSQNVSQSWKSKWPHLSSPQCVEIIENSWSIVDNHWTTCSISLDTLHKCIIIVQNPMYPVPKSIMPKINPDVPNCSKNMGTPPKSIQIRQNREYPFICQYICWNTSQQVFLNAIEHNTVE